MRVHGIPFHDLGDRALLYGSVYFRSLFSFTAPLNEGGKQSLRLVGANRRSAMVFHPVVLFAWALTGQVYV